MDEKLIQELLDEFIPTLESLEAQSTAALQFLKDQGKTNGKKLAPYLEDAAKAGNVRWLAVRLIESSDFLCNEGRGARGARLPQKRKRCN